MNVVVKSTDGKDVTNKFTIEKYDDVIKIKYYGRTNITAGNYQVELTYQEKYGLQIYPKC